MVSRCGASRLNRGVLGNSPVVRGTRGAESIDCSKQPWNESGQGCSRRSNIVGSSFISGFEVRDQVGHLVNADAVVEILGHREDAERAQA
jgi:hypothetical protein